MSLILINSFIVAYLLLNLSSYVYQKYSELYNEYNRIMACIDRFEELQTPMLVQKLIIEKKSKNVPEQNISEQNISQQNISEQKKKNTTKWMRNMLFNGMLGIEFLNRRYDPFDFKLKGWTDRALNSQGYQGNKYDGILDELYNKYYCNKEDTPDQLKPEMKLFMTATSDALEQHLTNTIMNQNKES
ncbi:MAG: hypothetical protein Terrestrivirus1_238 [Terrestrivirus sp.]|uniref:Uncharacterized protein n=1 Tax=Terrestrivirus sp. TaxID=2487775 RepID=A0A3G4ZLS4_9VIRU|nr:MAG: hypothetical protein Terrestrivirus1_238 [Terrestrivirus sp.]